MNEKIIKIVGGTAFFILVLAFTVRLTGPDQQPSSNAVLGLATNNSAKPSPKLNRGNKDQLMMQNKQQTGQLTETEKDQMKEKLQLMIQKRKEVVSGWKEGKVQQLEDLADYLGMSVEELRQKYQEGKSLRDIMAEIGMTQEEVHEFITIQGEERINKLFEAGKITREQAETMTQKFTRLMEMLMGRWFGGR